MLCFLLFVSISLHSLLHGTPEVTEALTLKREIQSRGVSLKSKIVRKLSEKIKRPSSGRQGSEARTVDGGTLRQLDQDEDEANGDDCKGRELTFDLNKGDHKPRKVKIIVHQDLQPEENCKHSKLDSEGIKEALGHLLLPDYYHSRSSFRDEASSVLGREGVRPPQEKKSETQTSASRLCRAAGVETQASGLHTSATSWEGHLEIRVKGEGVKLFVLCGSESAALDDDDEDWS